MTAMLRAMTLHWEFAARRAWPEIGSPNPRRTSSPVLGAMPSPKRLAIFNARGLDAFATLFASVSCFSNTKPSNSEHNTPSNAWRMSESLDTGARASGTSANAPLASPSMILSTMTHGPMASATSAFGLSALMDNPSEAAAADCNASVDKNILRPALFKPTIGAMTPPNTTGNTISIGVSIRSLDRKYGPGLYPPFCRAISRRTVARSRGNPFKLFTSASMLVLIHACMSTAIRRLTLRGPNPNLKLQLPNALASTTDAIMRTPLTHISRLACRHARPASKRNCRNGPGGFLIATSRDSGRFVGAPCAGMILSFAPAARFSQHSTMRSTLCLVLVSVSVPSAPSPTSTLTKSIKNSAGLKCSGHS